MALRGVDALKTARYFLQSGRGKFVAMREVVSASDVGAK
jgi:hypothetical protein